MLIIERLAERGAEGIITGCTEIELLVTSDDAGHPAYHIDTLRADLHRFVFLLGVSDGEELFGEPTP